MQRFINLSFTLANEKIRLLQTDFEMPRMVVRLIVLKIGQVGTCFGESITRVIQLFASSETKIVATRIENHESGEENRESNKKQRGHDQPFRKVHQRMRRVSFKILPVARKSPEEHRYCQESCGRIRQRIPIR